MSDKLDHMLKGKLFSGPIDWILKETEFVSCAKAQECSFEEDSEFFVFTNVFDSGTCLFHGDVETGDIDHVLTRLTKRWDEAFVVKAYPAGDELFYMIIASAKKGGEVVYKNIANRQQLELGDKITITQRNNDYKVKVIGLSYNYGSTFVLDPDWYIECSGENNGPYYWKQKQDGGTVRLGW
jgi:hypothetical protein